MEVFVLLFTIDSMNFLIPLGDLVTCNMETNYWENQKNNPLSIISALPLFLCISSPLTFLKFSLFPEDD